MPVVGRQKHERLYHQLRGPTGEAALGGRWARGPVRSRLLQVMGAVAPGRRKPRRVLRPCGLEASCWTG